MNKITDAFKGKKALITFVTGGDPDIGTTEKLIFAMEEAGADIIEIGIPFSDPIAEGVVIQQADERALAGGCTVDKLFDMVKRVRKRTDVPLAFMTYVNPIFRYGKDEFMRRCKECGIDGIIVPDLPFEENGEIKNECDAHGICLISMISPTSSEERVKRIAAEAKGFLYCVSSLGVTGVRSNIGSDIAAVVRNVKKISSVPCAVGFGISTKDQAHEMSEISDGVIVGSAIVNIVARYGKDSAEPVKRFVKELKAGTQ